jgi:hypothetical protein
LSRFAIGIPPVSLGLALGLAGGLVLNHTRNALFVGCLAFLDLGACCCGDGCFALCGFCLKARLLFGSRPLPRSVPLFACCRDRLMFCLAC